MRGLLQRWTKSSIILTSKGRISVEEQKAQKEDRFFRGRQIAYLIYEYFRVTGAKILLKYGWEKVPNWECFCCTSWKRIILICVRGWHEIGWTETQSWSDVERAQQRSRFGRTNIFPGSCILGLHPKAMWNKQKYCGQLQNHVRIANFRGESREITIPSQPSYFFMVLWHGGSCKEVCGTILWVGK